MKPLRKATHGPTVSNVVVAATSTTPDEGVKKVGIDPGTAFEDLDALAFRCPVCRSKVAAFRDIGPRAKASGFDENLDFGIGVNRMTPGQKNVLIFGSLALGFAFFLSLYSLR